MQTALALPTRDKALVPGRSPAEVVDADSPVIVKIVAAVALIVIAMRIILPQNVEVGFVVALLLTPIWIRSLRRFHLMPLLIGVGVLAVVAGIWLQLVDAGNHEIDASIATSTTVLLIGAVLSVGVVLWARTLFTAPVVSLIFGVGLVLGISSSTPNFADNPYKFGIALPLAVVTLSLAKLSRRWWVELIVVLGLIGLSAANDARSTFALLLLAVILLLAQLPFFRAGHGGSATLVAVGLVAVSIVVYNIGTALVLDGFLGDRTAARSLAQVESGGSLVLGGRPELGATIALMAHNILGFGAGVAPTASEVDVAKVGMKAIGYNPENGYVDRYMFGGHIELHSVFGDLWAQTGLVGLVFVAIVAAVLIAGITRNIADGTAGGILLYVAAKSLWDLAFSPFFSAEPMLVLAIGLAAIPVASRVRSAARQRTYSMTSSMGPRRSPARWNPARVSTTSSAADDALG